MDPETIAENGLRTFALCELMVHPDWQWHGVAHALHNELVHNRPEQRATRSCSAGAGVVVEAGVVLLGVSP